MPASARQLIAVKVSGSKRFSEQDIVAATGLQMGTPVNDDDFKRAARRLGDAGVFTDISYSYSYSSVGTKLDFHVVDADKFVPVRFEDFVWFSDADLLRRIKEHAPLFDGELPLSGRLPEEVSDVLQAMLVERSIPGHVEYERVGNSDASVRAILYRVADVLIQIRNVEFMGEGEAELPALTAASKRVFEREYSRTVLHSLVEKQLLPVYHSRGYLKASFGEPQPKVVKQPSAATDEGPRNLTVVDVQFPVTP
jgi:outer membrane protein assembly factor BamA